MALPFRVAFQGSYSGARARRWVRKPVPGEVATFGLSLQVGIVLQWPFLMPRRPPEAVYPGVCQPSRISGKNRFWGNLGRFLGCWRNKSWRRGTRKKERPPIPRRSFVAEDIAGIGQGAGLHAWQYRERPRLEASRNWRHVAISGVLPGGFCSKYLKTTEGRGRLVYGLFGAQVAV